MRTPRPSPSKVFLTLLLLVLSLSYVISPSNVYGANKIGLSRKNISIPTWPTTVLPVSVQSGSATVVTLPMGNKSNVLNQFWQLFTYDESAGKWQNVVSDLGVATNGGFSIVPDQNNQFTLIVLPTILLKFSPVDIMRIDTTRKTTASYLPLPPMTVNVSHALSDTTQIAGNTFMSIAQTSSGSYPEVATTSAKSWHRVSLSFADNSSCHLSDISSLFYQNNFLLFGTDCMSLDYRSPLFYYFAKQNTKSGLPVRGTELSFKNILPKQYLRYHNLATDTILWRPLPQPISGQVTDFAGGLVAILQRDKSVSSPVGFYTFSISRNRYAKTANLSLHVNAKSFLPLPFRSSVISMGRYGASGYFVLVKYPNRKTYLFLYKSSGSLWQKIDHLPEGIQTIAQPDNRSIQAFCIPNGTSGNIVQVYSYLRGQWILNQSIKVGIQYGSSS